MGKQKRRKFTANFKTTVALAAIKEQHTLSELSKKYEVNSVMISRWKKEFLANASAAFDKTRHDNVEDNFDVEKLYSQIGKLKVENDFLKKSCNQLGI